MSKIWIVWALSCALLPTPSLPLPSHSRRVAVSSFILPLRRASEPYPSRKRYGSSPTASRRPLTTTNSFNAALEGLLGVLDKRPQSAPSVSFPLPPVERPEKGRSYFALLWKPYLTGRATQRRQVQENVWVFEQRLGFLNVSEITRMTAIRTQTGGLFIYAPVAPTGECVSLLEDLNFPVEHFVLPCPALEHKIFFSDFVGRYPDAKVWVSPGQFSFPLNVSATPFRVDGVLFDDPQTKQELQKKGAPFGSSSDFEFDFASFFSKTDIGAAAEVAVLWKGLGGTARGLKRGKGTLLVADSVAFVDTRQRDEKRLAETLQVLFLTAPKRVSSSGFFFPPLPPEYGFCLDSVWVPPTVREWILKLNPTVGLAWVDRVASMSFDRIIACHFDADGHALRAGGRDFSKAFDFLRFPGSDEAERTLPKGVAPVIQNFGETLQKKLGPQN
uniref:DUF4336 domain-containing protein n=1 Tax=Chromera velia CCMP2878 TaxID=1169474 RepID=A0A0G4GKI2_9ALVE|eukprot:Cvel_22318.t1-p1 / transcript=Cvel_22318.t1 / gene=Cvel_22318 / organism=Chromera_velia_CCMP2878 / gene_product=hypothetical protein / transcript_product=hypothetical protein / location=Cvel_scaffold2182:20623-24426(+) / protein_length=443 / sequence_SO=supercontig / SO=protein_coding / is_pseudo=false